MINLQKDLSLSKYYYALIHKKSNTSGRKILKTFSALELNPLLLRKCNKLYTIYFCMAVTIDSVTVIQ